MSSLRAAISFTGCHSGTGCPSCPGLVQTSPLKVTHTDRGCPQNGRLCTERLCHGFHSRVHYVDLSGLVSDSDQPSCLHRSPNFCLSGYCANPLWPPRWTSHLRRYKLFLLGSRVPESWEKWPWTPPADSLSLTTSSGAGITALCHTTHRQLARHNPTLHITSNASSLGHLQNVIQGQSM